MQNNHAPRRFQVSSGSPCSVYIVGCPYIPPKPSREIDGYAVKIGIASNPTARLNQLQIGNPRPLELKFAFDFDNRDVAYQVEQHFHFRSDYASFGVGEWFDLDWRQALYFLTIDVTDVLRRHYGDEDLTQARPRCGLYRAFDILDNVPSHLQDKFTMLEYWRRNG